MKVLVGKRTGFVAILAALGIVAALTAALPASAVQPPAAADPAVITDWNTISANTIAGPGTERRRTEQRRRDHVVLVRAGRGL